MAETDEAWTVEGYTALDQAMCTAAYQLAIATVDGYLTDRIVERFRVADEALRAYGTGARR